MGEEEELRALAVSIESDGAVAAMILSIFGRLDGFRSTTTSGTSPCPERSMGRNPLNRNGVFPFGACNVCSKGVRLTDK
jgi:hypothetical protein